MEKLICTGLCPYPSCGGSGYEQYGGMCGRHWSQLSPERRAVLLGEEVIEKEVITYHHRVTVYPPRQPFLVVLRWLWGVLVTGAVAWLAWRMR